MNFNEIWGERMGILLNSFAVNQISKGTKIYEEGEGISTICLIIKGRVLVQNDGFKMFLGSGNFIGVPDLYNGSVLCNYVAYDDVTIFPFTVENAQSLYQLFAQNKDYAGLVVTGLSRSFVEAERIYQLLDKEVESLYTVLMSYYERFSLCAKRVGSRLGYIECFEDLKRFAGKKDGEIESRKFIVELSQVPVDIQKAFFGCSSGLAVHGVDKMTKGLAFYLEENIERVSYIGKLLEYLVGRTESALLYQAITVDKYVHSIGKINDELDRLVDDIIETVNHVEELLVKNTARIVYIDRLRLEREYTELITGVKQSYLEDEKETITEQDYERIQFELQDSMKKIVEYSKIPAQDTLEFKRSIVEFRNLHDKFSSSDEARLIRRGITKFFYLLYQTVFIRAYQEKCTDRVINLFLSYGFIDEKLLSQKQLVELYLLGEQRADTVPCRVYNIKDWLIEIYEGRKEPSKNEFDLDYTESVREKKRLLHLSEEEEQVLLNDRDQKLNYEIINMFQSNNRLVSGQVSTFVPILYDDLFFKGVAQTHVTANEINYQVNQLKQIDYSIFYRETLYYDKEKGIEKEFIQKEVFPDIILLPTYGSKGVMWQEISGKKRDSSGRFLLPSFTDGDIQDMLLTLFGRFHWELCRCMQGTSWNNIKYKSLTSEYVDYIQFYKKNHDLSLEAKERIKVQIQKGKNNSREVFLLDYINWIKNESNGSLRLNKVARELLAMYCPFSKEIRQKLSKQPLFADAMSRFERENHKKVHEIELRYKALEKAGAELTQELIKTKEFYSDF